MCKIVPGYLLLLLLYRNKGGQTIQHEEEMDFGFEKFSNRDSLRSPPTKWTDDLF